MNNLWFSTSPTNEDIIKQHDIHASSENKPKNKKKLTYVDRILHAVTTIFGLFLEFEYIKSNELLQLMFIFPSGFNYKKMTTLNNSTNKSFAGQRVNRSTGPL